MHRTLNWFLERERISVRDACAILAGYCPTNAGSSRKGDWSETVFQNVFSELLEPKNDKEIIEQIRTIERQANPFLPLMSVIGGYILMTDALRLGISLQLPTIDALLKKASEAGFSVNNLQPLSQSEKEVTPGIHREDNLPSPNQPLFDLKHTPQKPIVRLLHQFLCRERDAGREKPRERQFIAWVDTASPSEPLIKILNTGEQGIWYCENSSQDVVIHYTVQNISSAINSLVLKKTKKT